MRFAIGDNYNGQKNGYKLAYNKTSGIAEDLLQSALQALIQWDSQVMGWFNNIGVAPDWFNTWHQKFLSSFSTVLASELPEHVAQFSSELMRGEKVLVVSHSQGNFYVNEAKKIMQPKLPAEKMTGFSVFGIAVPSNNVAGEVQSYLTNHRDFIRFLPGALPQNWTLKRSNGDSVENVGAIQAHSFVDIYMSKNFDIRAAVVSNVHTKLKTIQQPTADCMIYRSAILSLWWRAFIRHVMSLKL